MADKGIIFSAPMVRALLDGRKTQTRRLVKPQPSADATHFVTGRGRHIWDWPGLGLGSDDGRELPRIPYAPGDRLYVREAFRLDVAYDKFKPTAAPREAAVFFKAGGKIGDGVPGKLHPSIHLPRHHSRLTLTVTDVRVQRVAEISEADAVAEGVTVTDRACGEAFYFDPVEDFRDLWNSLHTKPGETWADNPWVVAVTFAVAHGNIDRSNHA